MNDPVTIPWLKEQGAVFHDPWWVLGKVEVWVGNPVIAAINNPNGPRVENPSRDRVLAMSRGEE